MIEFEQKTRSLLKNQDCMDLMKELPDNFVDLIDILQDEGNPNVLDYIDDAVTAINDLLARAESEEARAEKAERERDAAVSDLLRAEEAAEETNSLLDDEVHPACDYSLYLAVHDSVSDIVNWEYDDVWRGHKEEKE